MRFIVASDGYPDSVVGALTVARTFKSKIDAIYVGPEYERGGADFLRQLAAAAGGQYVMAEKAAELANATKTLMLNTAA